MSCESMETVESDTAIDGSKIFIGNIRPDVGKDLVVKKLKEHFEKIGVEISNEDFSALLKGSRKSKFMFTTLKNEEETECVINEYNGLKDSEIVAESRSLKVCLKEDRPSKRQRKRKWKNSQSTKENSENNDDESTRYGWNDVDDQTDEDILSKNDMEFPKDLQGGEINENSGDDDFEDKSFMGDSRGRFHALERGHGELEKESSFETKVSDDSSDSSKVLVSMKDSGVAYHSGGEGDLMTGVSAGKKPKFDLQGENCETLGQLTSTPNFSMADIGKIDQSRTKVLLSGQLLPNEDRKIEYKMGHKKYTRRNLIGHVRKYSCAFLNSEGGRLLIGVSDDGKVHGIPCNRKQEDLLRRQIDCVIARFHPPVFPDMYSVSFIPVIANKDQDLVRENELKVIEMKIESMVGLNCRLFETDKGEVYVRRDGSVQGPLKASQIIDWCSYHRTLGEEGKQVYQRAEVKVAEVKGQKQIDFKGQKQFNVKGQKEFDVKSQNDFALTRDQSWGKFIGKNCTYADRHALSRLSDIETDIRERQRSIEMEIMLIRGYLEAREKVLQTELEYSKNQLNGMKKKRKRLSAMCIIL